MVLYIKLRKSLYGCLRSSILFYRYLLAYLNKLVFTVNLYTPFVYNKAINRRPFNIFWHVGDLNFSRADPEGVTKMLICMEQRYSKIRISWGKKHNYIGIYLYCSKPG